MHIHYLMRNKIPIWNEMFNARVVVFFKHMETYKGRGIFEEEFKKEDIGQRGQINLLQAKYTAKMILTSMNKKEAKVFAGAEAYNKLKRVDSNPLIPNDAIKLKDEMVEKNIKRVTRILG